MKKEAKQFFADASNKLDQAKEELNKPEEDIVSYLVCKNSQRAIKNYLIGYLLKNNVKIGDKPTIDSLIAQCVKINKDFKTINLTEFNCTESNDSRYCSDVATVNRCHMAASALEAIIKKETAI